MSKIKSFLDKKNNITIILIFTFLFSVILRTALGVAFGQMSVFYDELLHWDISKSIYYGLGSNFRNDILSYKEILYSVVLSIAHHFGNTRTQYYAAVGINSILMSSVVFPVYFMSNRFLNNRYRSLIITFISIIIPEMFYTSKILQENLYYPVVMWFFCLFIVLIIKEQYRLRNVILLSILVFILSLSKQMGLNVFAGVILFYLLQFLFLDKDNRKKCFIALIWFAFVFVCLKMSYDTLFNILNGIAEESSSEVTIFTILSNIFDPYLLSQLIYPAITYLLLSIFYFGIFTVILPLSMIKKFNKQEQGLFLIIATIFISTIGVICLRIIPSENLDDTTIRFHFRYVFFLIVPLLILFFSIYDKVLKYKLKSWAIVFISAFYIIMLNYIDIIPAEGSRIDCVGANYIKYLFDNDMMVKTLHMLIILGICACLYLLYQRKVKVFYSIVVVGIILAGIISNVYTYNALYQDKKDSVNKIGDAIIVNDYFDSIKDFDWKSVLMISEKNVSDAKFESFLQRPDYFYTKTKDFKDYIADNTGESMKDLNLYSFNHLFKDERIDYPEYIITNQWMYITGYEKVDLDLQRYHVYKRSTDTEESTDTEIAD